MKQQLAFRCHSMAHCPLPTCRRCVPCTQRTRAASSWPQQSRRHWPLQQQTHRASISAAPSGCLVCCWSSSLWHCASSYPLATLQQSRLSCPSSALPAGGPTTGQHRRLCLPSALQATVVVRCPNPLSQKEASTHTSLRLHVHVCLDRPVHEQLSRVVRQAAEDALGTESLLVVLAALQVRGRQAF